MNTALKLFSAVFAALILVVASVGSTDRTHAAFPGAAAGSTPPAGMHGGKAGQVKSIPRKGIYGDRTARNSYGSKPWKQRTKRTG